MQNKKNYSIFVILTLSAIVGILTLSLSSISLSNENIPLVNALNATSIDSPFANATSIDSPFANATSIDSPFANATSIDSPFANATSIDSPWA